VAVPVELVLGKKALTAYLAGREDERTEERV
jgi:hypothetical protein